MENKLYDSLNMTPSVDVTNEEWYQNANAVFNARMADYTSYGQPGSYSNYLLENRRYQSNMDPLQTLGYLNAQRAVDSNWEYIREMGKSFYNGGVGVIRDTMNGIRAARDYNIALLNEQAKAQGIERNPDQRFIDAMDEAVKVQALQPYEVKQSASTAGQFGLDVAQGAGQLAGQVAVSIPAEAVLPGVGGMGLMMAQIAGGQYEDLKAKGVGTKRAAEAAFWNAFFQAPFERLSLARLMRKVPGGSVLKKKLKMVAEDLATEGITEFIQQFPEEWAELWALNPDASWNDLKEKAAKKFPDTFQNALYAGLIGAVLGAGSRGIHIALDRNINMALRKELHDEKMAAVETRIDGIKQSGISPDYAGETINSNLNDATVLIDGDVLLAYAQKAGEEKIADKLGVTMEVIGDAAKRGDTVEVKQGNFEAMAASTPEFFQAVQDSLSFDGQDMSNRKYEAIQANIARYSKLGEKQRTELKTEVDKIAATMEEAGMSKAQIEGMKAMLTSFATAMRPDNPAQFIRDNALRFEKGVRQRKEALFQTSTQIAAKYPNWMDNQVIADEKGKKGQSTQTTTTIFTYRKLGDFIKSKLPQGASVLDASSGLGLGTLELRNSGVNVEDIEPYPGGDRMKTNPPTYSGVNAYEQARRSGKQYDFIISNAVLNVIPDDWRQSVLHDMASLLKVGGQMFINVRRSGEEKGIKNKIELDSPQEVLVGTPDKIVSYQRFYTPQELAEYVKSELGDAYEVEVANTDNSGTKGLPAVVVTKKYEASDGYYQKTAERLAEGYTENVDLPSLAEMETARDFINQYSNPPKDAAQRTTVLQESSNRVNTVELNAVSAKDPKAIAYMREQMIKRALRDGIDEELANKNADALLALLDGIVDDVIKLSRKYPAMAKWQAQELDRVVEKSQMKKLGLKEEDAEAFNAWLKSDEKNIDALIKKYPIIAEWQAKGLDAFMDKVDTLLVPKLSAFKKNGEYLINIDLGTLCMKREAADVLNQILVDEGLGQKLGPSQLEALKDLLKSYGYLTACDVCFVEAKRVRMLADANKTSYDWKSTLIALGISDNQELGKERVFTEEQMKRLERMTDSQTYIEAFNEYMPKARRRTKAEGDKGADIDTGTTPDKMLKIAKLFKEDPSLAGELDPTLLITTAGTDYLARTYGGHTNIMPTLAGMYGSATSKPLEGFTLYDALSWRKSFDNAALDKNMEDVYAIGGGRAQSFTDFNPVLFLDYVQMVADYEARNMPMHVYTKVPAFVELFGETGIMINMSFVPEIVDGVDEEHAGLKYNEKTGEWDEYAWHEDSFPTELAYELRKRKEYGGRVGIIAVGVSKAHIKKLMADPNIDMVIPYHASGMPHSVKLKTGLEVATDYTDVQTTKIPADKKAEIEQKHNMPAEEYLNYSRILREPQFSNPRDAAKEYLRRCDDYECTPVFKEFRNEDGYFKVLEDFRGLDDSGNGVAQGPVRLKLPDNWKEILEKALGDRGKQKAMLGDLATNEEILSKARKILEPQRLDGEIREVMLKRLRSALGQQKMSRDEKNWLRAKFPKTWKKQRTSNVQSLKKSEFLNKLEAAYANDMSVEEAKAMVEVFRMNNGIVYGFAQNGQIFLNENAFNANTPAHEFTHVWAKVAQAKNPKLWAEGVKLLQTDAKEMWDQVANDPLYENIKGDTDAIASEVLARLVGEQNEEFVRELMDPTQKMPKGKGLTKRIQDWLLAIFHEVRSLFDPVDGKPLTYDEFRKMPLKTLWDVNANKQFRKNSVKYLQDLQERERVQADAVEMQGELYQQDSQIKGSFDPFTDGEAVIKLFEGSDASTVIHETGHYYIESMWREIAAGRATEQQKSDFEKLMNYCGMTTEQWANADIEGRRAAHERLAEAIETYVMEDKAPSRELRPVFKRFAKWLKSVYKAVSRNKNAVPLTDEVREVFDRMLASEEDVEEMKRVEGYFAKLPSTITDNLSDATKKRIEDYILKAQDKAVEILTKERLANFREERKLEIAEYRDKISEGIRQSVASQPLYVAARQAQELLGGEKAAPARAYANMYLEEKMSDENEVKWEMVAEQNGMSPSELAQKLLEEPTETEAYNAAMDAAVQQKFPDYYTEREQAEEATRMAMYNDESGILLGVEQQLIEDFAAHAKVQQRSAETSRKLAMAKRQQATVAAKNELARKQVKDAIRVDRYIAAERRCAVKSAEAMAKKDYETARQYKDMQAFNHAMVIESANMRKRVEQYRKFLRRQMRSGKETWTSDQHFNQAAALFARMGYLRKDFFPETRTQSLMEYIGEMSEMLYPFDEVPEWLADDTWPLTNPNNMTFDDYEKVINLIRYIKTMSRVEKAANFFDTNSTYQEWQGQASDNLNKLETKFAPILGEKQTATWMERFTAAYQNLDNFLERMDGWTFGFFSRCFGDAIKHANDNEFVHLEEYQKRKTEAEQAWCPDRAALDEAAKEVYYEELGTTASKFVLTKMLMNLGNEGNARKLCGTLPSEALRKSSLWVFENEGMTREEAIAQTKENLLEFLGRVLTKQDIAYAQAKVDIQSMYWDEIVALERRTKGFAPKKVEAYPVTLTLANGETVVFRGGYFPLIRNGEMGSHPVGAMPVSDTDPKQGKNVRTMHTDTGYTISRVEAEYPVDLSEGSEDRAMRNAIHDLCWRETMTNFRRILNDQYMFGLMKSKLGIAQMSAFREMLEHAAQPNGSTSVAIGESLFAQTAGWLRSRIVNSIVMLNFRINTQNWGNIFLYGNDVEGFTHSDTIAAITNSLTNGFEGKSYAEMWKFVDEKSAFMRSRSESPDITLAEMREENKLNEYERTIMDWGARAMMYTDGMSARPVWMQAYYKKLNAGATEQEAIDFADTIIRRTLGSGRVTDVASLQRGSQVFKLFTAFQGFFNTQFNQWAREYNIDKKLYSEKEYKEMAMRITSFVASKYLAACFFNLLFALENPFGRDDDDEPMNYTKELMHYPMTLVGIYGQVASSLADKTLGLKSYGYRMSIVESGIDKLFRTGSNINKMIDGDFAAGLESLTDIAGIYYGVPAQMNRLFWNAYDIVVNGMEPEIGDLMTRRPKRDRK